MKAYFEPVADKCGVIVEWIMNTSEMPSDEELRFKLRLAVEEVTENVVSYAYENGSGYLEVSTLLSSGLLTITFRDGGVPFNPLAKPDPDVTLTLEERQIGGLGIFLCKQMMDDVRYEYRNNCNILTLSKKVS